MAEGIRIGGGGKKSGAYVWKKYNQLILTPKIESGYTTIAISCKTSDLAELTSITELVGTTLSTFYYANNNYPCVLTSETTATLNNTVYAVTYNTTTKVITVDVDLSGGFTILSGGEAKAFLDFVVSDDETAYPDGGEQGGYWYELMIDGLDLSLFGCTKYAVDKFTFSSNTTYRNKISHSLGEIPKFTFIIGPEEYPSGTNTAVRVWCILARNQYFISYGGYVGSYASSKYTDIRTYNSGMQQYLAVTDSTINVNNDSSQSYFAGVEYTVITMA